MNSFPRANALKRVVNQFDPTYNPITSRYATPGPSKSNAGR